MSEPFYVGYQKKAPPELALWIRRRVTAVLLLVLLLAVGITTAQKHFTQGVFEYGNIREFQGTLRAHPVPFLEVTGEDGQTMPFLLVNPGKFGFQAGDADGRLVRIHGTYIANDGRRMLEVDTMEVLPEQITQPPPRWESLGTWQGAGEIVDSKCYLGVMNPGNLKTHKSCAIRCISGGIPPILLVRQEDGSARYLLLTGPQGQAIHQDVLPFVAEPVHVSGELVDLGDYQWLQVAPGSIQRL